MESSNFCVGVHGKFVGMDVRCVGDATAFPHERPWQVDNETMVVGHDPSKTQTRVRKE